MQVAVLSDIHGFSIAFDRVLADIAGTPEIDQIIIAGDLVEGGPDPAGTLERIRALDATVLQGNTDRDMANGSRSSKSAMYTMDQLGDEGLAFLRSLPFSTRVSPPGSSGPVDDLLVVHANPFDQDHHIRPDADQHELHELIGDTQASMIAFGHLHIAYIRDLQNLVLVDVSAVGNPKDGDLRSKWGLISWDDTEHKWNAELRYVNYPLAATEAQILTSDLPNPDKVIKKLKRATYE